MRKIKKSANYFSYIYCTFLRQAYCAYKFWNRNGVRGNVLEKYYYREIHRYIM